MLHVGNCVCHCSVPPDLSVCYVIYMNLSCQIAVKGYVILYLAECKMTLLFFLSQSTVTTKICPQNTLMLYTTIRQSPFYQMNYKKILALHSHKCIVSAVLLGIFVKEVLILWYFVYLVPVVPPPPFLLRFYVVCNV